MALKKLVFMATASIFLGACNSGSSQSNKPTADDWCMEIVKNNLKDSDSAKFKDISANKDEGGDKTLTWCKGMVNAKNSMGGYTGFQKFEMMSDGSVYFSQ